MKSREAYGGQKTLLVVDNDGCYVRLLARAMARLNFAVWPAQSVAEAKNAIDAIGPHCAVVDLHLDDGCGFDVLRHIAEHSPNTRTVLLSGYATPAVAIQAIKLGASDCFAKPVDVEVLARALTCDDNENEVPPDSAMEPDEVRLQHVLAHWEKNNRNTTQTAEALGMHRRTLQRILKRAGFGRSKINSRKVPTPFGKLRRLYRVWSRTIGVGGIPRQQQSRRELGEV